MTTNKSLAPRTRRLWFLNLVLFFSGIMVALTGVYFLYLPSGGVKGGRNPYYGITLLFSRHTWEDLHTWTGVAMILIALVHLGIHWRWVKMMSGAILRSVTGYGRRLSSIALINLVINIVVVLSFILCTVTGIYFLLGPTDDFYGGTNPSWDPGFVLGRATWDLAHTWSGIVLIAAAVIHLWMHWRWIVSVTRRLFRLPAAAMGLKLPTLQPGEEAKR